MSRRRSQDKILERLKLGPATSREIHLATNLSTLTVDWHLISLRHQGLVEGKRWLDRYRWRLTEEGYRRAGGPHS